ncbi:hypothetical protein AYO21_11112 [Fonsecaea monophora]|uniref:DUF1275 domain protein n=1 Tax=Fonsecaea monophora TaxID=254056 RepID=A0A177ETU8_9EURO|nr:hypothetical protein AYO21_11112 [Fonsecaea monophora]OAG34720.1 hypothetical protein AYO21_11112 [Fonsecaea monophora]
MASMNQNGSVSSEAKEQDRAAQVNLAVKEPQQKSAVRRLKRHLTSHIEVNILAETELLILTFCTGMQDATTFPDYHCFASNQTGNTVMLAMAILLPDVAGELFITENIGIALGFFLAAGWLTGQLGHIIGARSRLWIVFCNLIQTILVFIAAAIQYTYGIELEGTKTMVIIGLLAFAAGSQVVISRALAITEITTAMATAAWIDLLIDPRLLTAKNRPRNRRASFLVAIVAGAFFGAGIYQSLGPATSVLFSAIGKLIVTFMFLLNKAEKPQESRSIV